jgi:hypothetical protein
VGSGFFHDPNAQAVNGGPRVIIIRPVLRGFGTGGGWQTMVPFYGEMIVEIWAAPVGAFRRTGGGAPKLEQARGTQQ